MDKIGKNGKFTIYLLTFFIAISAFYIGWILGAQLHHQEEPPEHPRSAHAQEVLLPLRQAHRAPRDPLIPLRRGPEVFGP